MPTNSNIIRANQCFGRLTGVMMGFPEIRMRRLRISNNIRRLVRENSLSVDDLVYPLFVCQGENVKEPIVSMTDCFGFSPDTVAAEAARYLK